jgi:hypothetical protein
MAFGAPCWATAYRRDKTGLLRLGESQVEEIVNGAVGLTGNGYGARRQLARAHERFEERRRLAEISTT